MTTFRSQSAVEYLTTYGWAILIMAIVIAVLFEMGVFSPNVPSECVFSDFECLSFSISTSGMLTINVEQATTYPIEVTAIGCDSQVSTSHMVQLSPAVQLQIGSNFTETVQCWENGSAFSGNPGSRYEGYAIINYTNLQTGFPYVDPGSIVQRVK